MGKEQIEVDVLKQIRNELSLIRNHLILTNRVIAASALVQFKAVDSRRDLAFIRKVADGGVAVLD